jgi:hypothetical protein
MLTDSVQAYEWLKLASCYGQDLETPYDSSAHIKNLC